MDAKRMLEVAQALDTSVIWMMEGTRNGKPLLSTLDMADAAKFIRQHIATNQICIEGDCSNAWRPIPDSCPCRGSKNQGPQQGSNT